jgi:hypothetical protein
VTRSRLSPVLSHERDELERHLRQHPGVEDVAGVLSIFFTRLSDAVTADDPGEDAAADAAARPTLRLRQRERLDQLQEAIRAGFVGVLRAIRSPAAGPPRPGPSGPDATERHDEGRLLGVVPRFWQPPPPPPRAPAPARPAPAQVDVPLLLSALEGALGSADQVLDTAEPLPAERVPIPWAEDSDWMELCQDLLRARLTDDGPLALSHIERLRRWLPDRHGIDVIEAYEGDDEHFRVVIATDPAITAPRVQRPALVVRGRPGAVLRGEVILPAGVPTAIIETPPGPTGQEASIQAPPGTAHDETGIQAPPDTADEEKSHG